MLDPSTDHSPPTSARCDTDRQTKRASTSDLELRPLTCTVRKDLVGSIVTRTSVEAWDVPRHEF